MGRNVRTGSIPVSSTLFSVHSFLCARFFLFPIFLCAVSCTRFLCVRLLVRGFFVHGFFVRVLVSLCQQALPDDASWHPCAPRQRYCWPVRHGRDTAGRSADRQDCEQVSSSRSAIGKKLLAGSLYEPLSGKTYWQKRTKTPILCSESGDWHQGER